MLRTNKITNRLLISFLLIGFTPIGIWSVFYHIQIKERYISWQPFTLLAAISIVLIVTSCLLALYISKPVITLFQAITELAKGNLDVQADSQTNDETGRIVVIFNKVVLQIKREKTRYQLALREAQANKELLEKQKAEIEKQALTLNKNNEQMQLLNYRIEEEKGYIQQQNEEIEANNKMLINMAKSKSVQRGFFEQALKEITQKTAFTLSASRVGIWEFDDEQEGLHCLTLFDKDQSKFREDYFLHRSKYKSYFETLESGNPINISVNDSDTSLGLVFNNYFQSNHLIAKLDIPYFVDGYVKGIISCEQKQMSKNWGLIETNFLKSVADIVTITFKSMQRRMAEEQIIAQKDIIEQKNHDILASIGYAQRIQAAILPTQEQIDNFLNGSFILYKPKDIISGDFYWIEKIDETVVIVVADCTGHGVPGAFMTMIGDNQLEQIVRMRKITDPDLILNELNKGVMKALKQDENDVRDGMDVAIVSIHQKDKKMYYAGAMNPIYYIQNGTFFEIKADKRPIGGRPEKETKLYTKHVIDISSPTSFYLCSDGFQDQFGGPDEKKFMLKRLRELIQSVQGNSMAQQKQIFMDTLSTWQSDYEQNDDILVFGAII